MRTSLQSSSGYTSLYTYFAFHYAPVRISLCSHSHFIMLPFALRYAPIRISLCFKTSFNSFPRNAVLALRLIL